MEISGVAAAEPAKLVAGKQTLGKEDFMKLLLQQLSHQDPLNPMESAEFTSQLTQFSSLEQLSNIESTLKGVLDFQQSMQNASLSNLLGRTINSSGKSVALKDGAGEVKYKLPEEASSVKVTIYDGDGKTVLSTSSDAKATGKNTFVWDGKDSAGNVLADGLYEFDIHAEGASGNPLTVESISSGVVTGIVFDAGIANLVLDDGRNINLSEIQTIQ